jgi:hypothetical protein
VGNSGNPKRVIPQGIILFGHLEAELRESPKFGASRSPRIIVQIIQLMRIVLMAVLPIDDDQTKLIYLSPMRPHRVWKR